MEFLTYRSFLQINKGLDKPFVLNWWALDCLFMPSKYLDDLKKADSRSLSFFQSLSDVRIITSAFSLGIGLNNKGRLSICGRPSAIFTTQTL